MATRSVRREYIDIKKYRDVVNRCLEFLLALIFVHPGTWIKVSQMVIVPSLARYLINIHNIIPTLEDCVHVLQVILGDFKVNTDSKFLRGALKRCGGIFFFKRNI